MQLHRSQCLRVTCVCNKQNFSKQQTQHYSLCWNFSFNLCQLNISFYLNRKWQKLIFFLLNVITIKITLSSQSVGYSSSHSASLKIEHTCAYGMTSIRLLSRQCGDNIAWKEAALCIVLCLPPVALPLIIKHFLLNLHSEYLSFKRSC